MAMYALKRATHFEALLHGNVKLLLHGIHSRLSLSNQRHHSSKCSRDNILETKELRSARQVFDEMHKPTSEHKPTVGVTVGIVMDDYFDDGFKTFRRMMTTEDMWDKLKYIKAFSVCAYVKDLDLGRQIHSKLIKDVDQFDVEVCNALINMYLECGEIQRARNVFDMSKDRNLDSWNVMLAAYAAYRSYEELLKLFSNMQHEGNIIPDESTFFMLLHASAELFSLSYGNSLHAMIHKIGYATHKTVEDGLIGMYERAGDIQAAKKVFLCMSNNNRDVLSWNLMISGYGRHSLGKEALDLFEDMLESGEAPNCFTFIGVLSACAHLGLVEKGFYYFYELMKEKGVEPIAEHYACMVNILTRAGRLEEALGFILSTPIKQDAFVWRSFLGACYGRGNDVLATRATKLIPGDVEPADVVPKISKLCGPMERKGPGVSWLEIKDKTYVFDSYTNGDPGFDKLHETIMKPLLNSIFAYVKLRDADKVVHDVEVRDFVNSYHSELVAVAYALLRTHEAAPICIIKESGQVCPDSHLIMKMISKAKGRLITVRDVNQFHRFQEGTCSCKDY